MTAIPIFAYFKCYEAQDTISQVSVCYLAVPRAADLDPVAQIRYVLYITLKLQLIGCDCSIPDPVLISSSTCPYLSSREVIVSKYTRNHQKIDQTGMKKL
jgi:hypothetical protein